MNDLTVIFLTENRLPGKFMKYQRRVLLDAIGKNDLITISRKPINMGKGINLIQKKPRSLVNIWVQMLRGAKMAKTRYIAVAEDDTLYCYEHFNSKKIRPKYGFSYNQCNWKIFNWGTPTYHWVAGARNYAFIGSREMSIKALEERFKTGITDYQAGEIGRRKVDLRFGSKSWPVARVWTHTPIININHDKGFDELAQRHRKRMGMLRTFDVPHWGKANELIKRFNG